MRDCAYKLPEIGLGWHAPMRWGTAGAFSSLYTSIEDDMAKVSYPFLVIHDPGDKTCFYAGSEKLMEYSSSSDKTLCPLDVGGYHGIAMVKQDLYVSMLVSWIRA